MARFLGEVSELMNLCKRLIKIHRVVKFIGEVAMFMHFYTRLINS